jgi:hypothetical protein
MKSYSQASQDIFALTLSGHKKNGTFLEIGSNHPINHSNTYLMESQYNWRGVMVEIDNYLELYKTHRPSSIPVIADATKVNYSEILDSNKFPTVIDYLQIDLDVDNKSTLDVLLLLNETVFDKYKFSTITFEHDIYTGNYYDTREISRKIFKERGYILLFPDVYVSYNGMDIPFEDWYIHPDCVNFHINELLQYSKPNMHHNKICSLLQTLSIYDNDIKTEYQGNISSLDEVNKDIHPDYYYSMFKVMYTKQNIDYYCERVCIKQKKTNGINGLYFYNSANDDKRFYGTEYDAQDPRLFEFNDKLYVIFTCDSTNPGQRMHMGISEYDNFNPVFLKIGENTENITINKIEKNWAPLVPIFDNNQTPKFIYLIYKLDPLIILKYNFNQEGICDVVFVQKDKVSNLFLRCSTPFIHLKDQYYLSAVHSRIYTDIRYYYLPYLCVLDINLMKIVYISGNILFKCDENDSITKVDGTNIMIYTKTCYYTDTNKQLNSVSHCINYPGSIQKMDNSMESNMEFIMTAQLNGPTLKYKFSFDINVILEKINNNNLIGLIDWDDKVKQSTVQFIENIPYNMGVDHCFLFDY